MALNPGCSETAKFGFVGENICTCEAEAVITLRYIHRSGCARLILENT